MKPNVARLRALKQASLSEDPNIQEKLSLAECQAILQEEGKELTDARIVEIRDYLYRLAAISWDQYQHHPNEQATIINLKQPQSSDHEESHYLRTG